MHLIGAQQGRADQAAHGLRHGKSQHHGEHVVGTVFEAECQPRHHQRPHEDTCADGQHKLAEEKVCWPVQAAVVQVQKSGQRQQHQSSQNLLAQTRNAKGGRRQANPDDGAQQDDAKQRLHLVGGHAQRAHQAHHTVALLGR